MYVRDAKGRFVKGTTPPTKGRKRTAEERQKMSKSLKKHFESHEVWNKGVKVGIRPPNYKGWKKTSNGYMHIRQSYHPLVNKDGYVPEQVLVAEMALKRHLNSKEEVHHINFNKIDNRLKNLYLFPDKATHMKFHRDIQLGKYPPNIKSNLI